jgi:hypothetical protein
MAALAADLGVGRTSGGPTTDREAVIALFDDVRAAFPDLAMHVHLEHPELDVRMDIPQQPGLAFTVNLNLQGDELHLAAGSFWLEWFPCTTPEIRDQYLDAVVGLISGRYRILEHRLGNWPVKAQLQEPRGKEWKTIGTWGNLGTAVPWPKRQSILQNISPAGAAVQQQVEADKARER